jgi:hypothetical protein
MPGNVARMVKHAENEHPFGIDLIEDEVLPNQLRADPLAIVRTRGRRVRVPNKLIGRPHYVARVSFRCIRAELAGAVFFDFGEIGLRGNRIS